MILSQNAMYIKGLDPVADAFEGTVYTDIINMKNFNDLQFVVYKGVGTTGTSTLTVEACDDTSASNTTAIVFKYKRCCNTADVQGALTAATTSGFTTTAGSSEIYVISVSAEDVASTGYGYVRLKAVQSVDAAVLGGILVIGYNERYGQDVPASAIV